MNIKDKIIIVTGGGSGIGAALCRAFAKAGARAVIVADLNGENAQAVADEMSGTAMTVDVTQETQIADMVAKVEQEHGHIDLMCSNAGIGTRETTHVASAPNDAWQQSWEVNVMAHVWAARACLPGMLKRGEGYFLNTASAAGLLSQIGNSAYAVTKHAAVGFAESLAITHGDDGIRVSVLAPQGVDTPMLARAPKSGGQNEDGVISAEEVAQCVIDGIEQEQFLILPHPQVLDYMRNKTTDYNRWIGGMRKLRRSLL